MQTPRTGATQEANVFKLKGEREEGGVEQWRRGMNLVGGLADTA